MSNYLLTRGFAKRTPGLGVGDHFNDPALIGCGQNSNKAQRKGQGLTSGMNPSAGQSPAAMVSLSCIDPFKQSVSLVHAVVNDICAN